jgi:hypothetical protein
MAVSAAAVFQMLRTFHFPESLLTTPIPPEPYTAAHPGLMTVAQRQVKACSGLGLLDEMAKGLEHDPEESVAASRKHRA